MTSCANCGKKKAPADKIRDHKNETGDSAAKMTVTVSLAKYAADYLEKLLVDWGTELTADIYGKKKDAQKHFTSAAAFWQKESQDETTYSQDRRAEFEIRSLLIKELQQKVNNFEEVPNDKDNIVPIVRTALQSIISTYKERQKTILAAKLQAANQALKEIDKAEKAAPNLEHAKKKKALDQGGNPGHKTRDVQTTVSTRDAQTTVSKQETKQEVVDLNAGGQTDQQQLDAELKSLNEMFQANVDSGSSDYDARNATRWMRRLKNWQTTASYDGDFVGCARGFMDFQWATTGSDLKNEQKPLSRAQVLNTLLKVLKQIQKLKPQLLPPARFGPLVTDLTRAKRIANAQQMVASLQERIGVLSNQVDATKVQTHNGNFQNRAMKTQAEQDKSFLETCIEDWKQGEQGVETEEVLRHAIARDQTKLDNLLRARDRVRQYNSYMLSFVSRHDSGPVPQSYHEEDQTIDALEHEIGKAQRQLALLAELDKMPLETPGAHVVQ